MVSTRLVIAVGLLQILTLQSKYLLVSSALLPLPNSEEGGIFDPNSGGSKSGELISPVLRPLKTNPGPIKRAYFTDASYIPYIHPRFVYQEDLPELPVPSKRAPKGMLVDVVDFVTKGSGGRSQRLGQDMRSSGRR